MDRLLFTYKKVMTDYPFMESTSCYIIRAGKFMIGYPVSEYDAKIIVKWLNTVDPNDLDEQGHIDPDGLEEQNRNEE